MATVGAPSAPGRDHRVGRIEPLEGSPAPCVASRPNRTPRPIARVALRRFGGSGVGRRSRPAARSSRAGYFVVTDATLEGADRDPVVPTAKTR